MKVGFILIILMFAVCTVKSQIIDSTIQYSNENQLENQVKENSNDADLESSIDLSQNLIHQKINLNLATADDLKLLIENNLITPLQSNALLLYIKHFGTLLSIYELQAVPSWDLQTIYTVLPFVFVNTSLNDYRISNHELLFKGNYQVLIRDQYILEKQPGFDLEDTTSSHYLGSKHYLYSRFRYSFGNRISYGITGQKDAGEEFFKGSQSNGFDFYSAHLYFQTNSFLKAAVIGDYEIKFGQGLLVWSGFGSGKSSQVLMIEKSGRTLKPYTSTDEYNFFRGAAGIFGNSKFEITLFGSSKMVDANVSTLDTISDELIISSVGGDGNHRTLSEMENRKVFKQSSFGGNFQTHFNNFSIGFSAIKTKFDATLQKTIYPYNQFDFNGNQLLNASTDFKLNLTNASLFGECAMSDNGGKAILAGALISLDRHLDFSIAYRNYQKNFQSLFANAFGESSTPNNEKGIYTGLVVRPLNKIEVDAYADFYQKPWLDYQVDAPLAFGNDYILQLTYRPSKLIELYLKYKTETKQENLANNISISDFLSTNNHQSFRFNFTYKITPVITLRNRAEWSLFQDQNVSENGFLAYQDFSFKPENSAFDFNLRYYLFDISGYDARIYVYENDVLYAYSFPALQNRGSRFYLLMQYHMNKHFDLWIRYAQTWYQNLNIISSGLDQINSPHKSELKTELRYSF